MPEPDAVFQDHGGLVIIIVINTRVMPWSYTMKLHHLWHEVINFYRIALISIHWVKIFQFFLSVFTWDHEDRPGISQKFKLRFFSIMSLVFFEICPKQIYSHLVFTCSNQSPQRKHKNKAWDSGAFRTMSNIWNEAFCKNT